MLQRYAVDFKVPLTPPAVYGFFLLVIHLIYPVVCLICEVCFEVCVVSFRVDINQSDALLLNRSGCRSNSMCVKLSRLLPHPTWTLYGRFVY